MILSTDSIEKLCYGNHPLITPYDVDENRKNPAKTELHLGDYCYCSDQKDSVIKLKDDETVIIKPNSIFLFQTKETFEFPKHLAGHMSLKMGWIAKGLFMPSQTQVDPGYNNVLFGMIYNLSSKDVEIKKGEALTTLEVFKAEKSVYPYSGKMAKTTFEQFVSTRIGSSLGKLENEIKESKGELDKNIKTYKGFTTIISIIIAIITIIITVVTAISAGVSIRTAYKDDATIKELENKVYEIEQNNIGYQDLLDEQKMKIAEYEKRIADLESTLDRSVKDNSGTNKSQ